jgi:hypothetical protein
MMMNSVNPSTLGTCVTTDDVGHSPETEEARIARGYGP